MIHWVLLILTIVFIVITIKSKYYSGLNTFGTGMSIILGITLVVSSVIICVNNISVDGYIARMNTRHDMLVYKYESDIYKYDWSKREVVAEIQDWNEDLSSRRELQDNFWVGIYYPNIYDQFEFIELK